VTANCRCGTKTILRIADARVTLFEINNDIFTHLIKIVSSKQACISYTSSYEIKIRITSNNIKFPKIYSIVRRQFKKKFKNCCVLSEALKALIISKSDIYKKMRKR